MRNLFVVLSILFLLNAFNSCKSCKNKKNDFIVKVDKKEITKIQKQMDVDILRYEEVLFSIDQNEMAGELSKIKKDYAFFLGDNPATPQNIKQLKGYINNNVHQDLYKEVKKQ